MRTDAGYRPMTAPISARTTSERRRSAAAGVLLVNRKKFGRRRAKEQDAFVQPHNTVKWRNDVEAGLDKDTDHTPEAGDKSIFGNVQGEERGNKSPDHEHRRQCRQGAPKHDVRWFIRRGGLFRHSHLPTPSDPIRLTNGLRHLAPT